MGNLDKESFKIFKISEIGTIISGATPKTSDDSNFGGAIPWLTPADLSGYKDKYISCGARNITQKGYDSCSTQLMPAGSVLLSSRAPIGYVAIAKNPICTNQGFKSIVPKTNVDSEYLYYHLLYLKKTLQDMGSGTTFKELSAKKLGQVEVSLPSLNEQKRIVARIEELFSELDAAVATLERTKEQLAVYRQAVLKEAFEEISEFVTLQSISEKIFDGPFGSNLKTADYTTSGIRVVRLENLKNGWFDDSKQSFVTSDKYEKISSHTVYPTDLIMSTFISDAIKVCQLPEYIEYAVNKADCVGIRLKESVNQRYVMYYLLTQQAFSSLEHNVHGATRPRVNTTHIKEINVPICDRKKQNQIVSEVESRLSVCDKIEETVTTALQEAEAMRQSILKQAFAGEL